MATTNKDLQEKLRKLLNGELSSHNITKEEGEELLKLASDESKLEKTRKALNLDSTEELTALFPALLQTAGNGESYLARLEGKMKRGELTEKLSVGFNTLLNLTQMGVASKQIAKSNRDLASLQRPSIPTAPTDDPALNQALSEAQRGTFDAGRAVSPVIRQIRNNRLRDEIVARQMGGGQGGLYGALNQASSLRALGAYGELAPLIDNIRAREQSRVDDLLQMRQQSRQQNFQNRMSIYDAANQNYNNDAMAAAQLGQAGRENLFGALGGLTDNLAVAGGYLQGKNFRLPNLRKRIAGTSGVKELDDFTNQANTNLNNQFNPYYYDNPNFDDNWNMSPIKY